MPLRGTKSQNLAGRDVVSIFDLSDADILSVFALADEMEHFSRGRATLGQDKILASLFYEPSTRTRFSFEAAMIRLGGGVISCADVSASSVAKGETLADTIRILHSYADVIIIRHPLEGSARAAADYSTVPIINAGDGAHEHPTQTLLDLYTIRKEKGVIAGVNVALVGDLKHGRTAHSLAFGLARFGAKITCVAPKGLEMPDWLLDRLEREHNVKPDAYHSLADFVSEPKRLAEKGEGDALTAEILKLIDVIYVTRVQKERFKSQSEFAAVKGSYGITAKLLRSARHDTLIMHPLPRVDELDYEIDADPRAAYFRQAAYGLPVRMGLLSAVLSKRKPKLRHAAESHRKTADVDLTSAGIRCANARCITTTETYLRARFVPILDKPNQAYCYYCGMETRIHSNQKVR
jgi:aspartate carbamoyltransferase catalytic subunit